MKKLTSLSAIALSLVAATGVANAEVDLYGKVSAGIGSTYSDSVKNTRVDSQGSYIGFKGKEALTGNANAIWQLEQGVELDGGENRQTTMKDLMRDSFVGLQHDQLGTIKLGKNSSSYKDVGGELDLFADQTASVESGFGRLNDRINNSVKYDTPNVHGLSASATYGNLENREVGSKVKSDVYAGALKYDLNQKLKVGAGYQRHNDVQGSSDYMYGVKGSASYTFDNGAMVGTGAERLVYNPKKEAGSRMKQDAVTVSGLYPIGNIDLKGNYTRVLDARGAKDTGANIYTAGAQYNFSKRTAFGSYFSMIDNDKNAIHDFKNNGVGVDGASVQAGENVRSYGATLSHKF